MMCWHEIEEKIRVAASSFDGHVTNGSHAEIMKVVRSLVECKGVQPEINLPDEEKR